MHHIFDLRQGVNRRQVHALLKYNEIAIYRIKCEAAVLHYPQYDRDAARNKRLHRFKVVHFCLPRLFILVLRVHTLLVKILGPGAHPEQYEPDREGNHHVAPIAPLGDVDGLDVLDGVGDREKELEGQDRVDPVLADEVILAVVTGVTQERVPVLHFAEEGDEDYEEDVFVAVGAELEHGADE